MVQACAFSGMALTALPLALSPAPPTALAVACLTANNAFYATSYGGFHAHLQARTHTHTHTCTLCCPPRGRGGGTWLPTSTNMLCTTT